MKRITKQQVLEGLERVVAKHGADTEYEKRMAALGVSEPYGLEGCLNWAVDANGEKVPACIVGVLLAEEFAVDMDEVDPSLNAYNLTLDLGTRGVITFDSGATDAMKAAQYQQDIGATWGAALLAAAATDAIIINRNTEG